MTPDGALRISEVFESIQGEGASAGISSLFVRLAVCNLRCAFCDTRYTWDWSAYRYEDEVREVSVAQIAARVAESAADHVVITGGEPLLQQAALEGFLDAIAADRYVEVETNGTLAPSPALVRRIDQWNVSPKLANSGEPLERRIRPEPLAAFRDTGRAYLKLVVEAESDAAEIDVLLRQLDWPHERILLMPQATTRAALRERAPLVLRVATARNLRVSPRLHVEKWDGRRGV